MDLKTLLRLKAMSGAGATEDVPFQFSAVGGDGDPTPNTTNNYGTTLDTTSAENNTVTVTQVYNSDYDLNSYRNGYVNIFFNKLNDFIEDGKVTFTADIDITANPASVTTLRVIIGGNHNEVDITEGKLSWTTGNSTPSAKKYVELRCGGCSFTLSNCKLTDA